jgi:hypothetical protein
MAVWYYSLWSLGILFPFWYVRAVKNLATLVQTDFIYNHGHFASAFQTRRIKVLFKKSFFFFF